MLIIHQAVVKSVTETLRARIVQQIYIIGKYKLLLDSQILNWANQACFREEFPLGSLGLKNVATSNEFFYRK
jgi:hypothetical protein